MVIKTTGSEDVLPLSFVKAESLRELTAFVEQE